MAVPVAALLGAVSEASGAFGKMNAATGEVTGLFRQAQQPFRSLVGAIMGIPEFFKGIAQSAAAWVKEFNPGIVERMNASLRSLTATVGATLEPVVAGFADATREFAGSLLEGLDRLRPAVEQTVALFRTAMQPALHLVNRWLLDVADRARTFAPLLQALGDWLDAALTRLAVVYETFSVVSKAMLELAGTVGDLLAGLSPLAQGMGWQNFQDVLGDTRTLFLELNKAGVVLVDTILRLAGQGQMADQILRGLAQKHAASGRPEAPRDIGLSDTEAIYRRRLVEAAKGQGMDSMQRQLSVMEDMRRFAESQLASTDKVGSIAEMILRAMEQIIERLRNDPAGSAEWAAERHPVYRALRQLFDQARQQARNSL